MNTAAQFKVPWAARDGLRDDCCGCFIGGVGCGCDRVLLQSNTFKPRYHKSKHEANLASTGTRVNLIQQHLRQHLATHSRESATTASFAAVLQPQESRNGVHCVHVRARV